MACVNMRVARVGSRVILQRPVAGVPAATVCQIVGRSLFADERGLQFTVETKEGSRFIVSEPSQELDGYPFIVLNM